MTETKDDQSRRAGHSPGTAAAFSASFSLTKEYFFSDFWRFCLLKQHLSMLTLRTC